MAELATGYVSLVAQTGGMQKAISDSLRDATKNIPEGPGRAIGDRLSSGITKSLKVGAVAAGGAVAATLGGAIAKGFSRLSNIDQAEAKLVGLGNSAEDVATIMDSASAAVTGTSFGLDEAATTAASAVAAGIEPGKELERTLSIMGDAATIAGTDMSTMGSIVNKVATSDMMQMDVANQMMDAGIPILQMVADEMGVTAEEARKMASEGKVSFETFQDALDSGLGGAALESGNTFKGALANMGAAMGRFGATLIGPIFDNAPAVFGAIGDAFDLLGEKVGPLAETFGEWLAPKMEDFANNIGPMLETSIENVSNFVTELWEKLNQVSDWYSNNSDWINSIAVAVGAAATAWGLWVGAIKTWQAITKTATAIQVAFNAVMSANPIMLAVMAIAALVAGLVYFFTQTETGKEVWNSLVEAFSAGWEWVKSAFQTSIDAVVGAWNWLVEAFSAGWEWVKNAFQTSIDAVVGAWNWLVETLQTGWNTVRDFVVNAWNSAWDALKSGFTAVTDSVKLAWQWLKDTLVNAWNTIRDAVVNAFINAWDSLRAKFDHAMELIGNAWQFLKDALHAGWVWIDENVLGGFRRGMDAFKSFFENVVDGIKSVWDGLRSALAKPINFMINTVYNDGILRAWNTIAGFLPGLDTASPLAGIPERAEGGSIFGPGTETSDSILARLSNNEHVWTAREVRRAGGHGNIYAMRALIDSRIPFTFDGHGQLVPLPARPNNRAGDLYGAAPDLLPAFKSGGEVTPLWEHQLIAGHKFAQSQSGKPYQWAGPNGPNSSFDCSGFMGSIAATIQGTNPWQRYWATGSFPSPGAQGFVPGLGPGFSIGIFNGGPYGGHTAGTLSPAGTFGATNVESGGSPSKVKYGTGAVGADHSQFTMQYHLPIGADGAFVSGGGGGISPEEMMDGIKKKISDLIDKAMNPILNLLPEGPPEWLNIPKGAYDKGKGALLDGAFELVGKLGDSLASVWTAAGEVKDLVTGTVRDAASWVNNTVRDVFVRDQGGLVPHGAAAVNTSGRDELMLPPSTTAAFNKFLSQMPGTAGALERSAVAFQAAAEEMGLAEQARKSAEDYATTQAGGFLSNVGLEGLVPLAVKAGAQAWDSYQASPFDVSPHGQTVIVEYSGDENDREWKLLNKIQAEVNWLKAKRKPRAGARTRGGVM